jgi:ComF family protein
MKLLYSPARRVSTVFTGDILLTNPDFIVIINKRCFVFGQLSGFLKGFLDFLYPRTCAVCKKNLTLTSVDGILCLDCWGKIKKNIPPFCRRCGRTLEKKSPNKNICAGCIKNPVYFDRAFSPCLYEGPVKDLVHQFKYQGKDYLAPVLTRLMTDFIREFDVPVNLLDIVVPVPLFKTRLRQREFNQAQVLAEKIAVIFNKKLVADNLIRVKNTHTQTELMTLQRLSNVKGCFKVKEGSVFEGKNILLVDDVLTTGATCSEAANALKQSKANIVFVITAAS